MVKKNSFTVRIQTNGEYLKSAKQVIQFLYSFFGAPKILLKSGRGCLYSTVYGIKILLGFREDSVGSLYKCQSII